MVCRKTMNLRKRKLDGRPIPLQLELYEDQINFRDLVMLSERAEALLYGDWSLSLLKKDPRWKAQNGMPLGTRRKRNFCKPSMELEL